MAKKKPPSPFAHSTAELLKRAMPELKLTRSQISAVDKSVEILERMREFGERVYPQPSA